MILEASSTVNGLVIALANPKPQAIIETRNPVNESKPTRTHSAVTMGSIVSISSNCPRNAPKHMKISAIAHSKRPRRFRNRCETAPTRTRMPPTSFMIWNAPKMTSRNSDSIRSVSPLSEKNTRTGARSPLYQGMPFAPSDR